MFLRKKIIVYPVEIQRKGSRFYKGHKSHKASKMGKQKIVFF